MLTSTSPSSAKDIGRHANKGTTASIHWRTSLCWPWTASNAYLESWITANVEMDISKVEALAYLGLSVED